MNLLKLRSVALIATIALMGVTAATASGATGAYFSATNTGEITGSLGSIQLDTSGGDGTDGLDFTLSGLLPGESHSVTVEFENTGNSPQDLYLVLDSTDVATLNSFSGWAAITIVRGDGTMLWDSASGLFASPMQIRGASVTPSLGAGDSGSFIATFEIAPSATEPNLPGPATTVTVGYDIVATQVGVPVGA